MESGDIIHFDEMDQAALGFTGHDDGGPVGHPPEPHYPVAGSDMEMDIYRSHYDAGPTDVEMNGDGHADELTITDESGRLISHTEFNEHTHHWDETPLEHHVPGALPER